MLYQIYKGFWTTLFYLMGSVLPLINLIQPEKSRVLKKRMGEIDKFSPGNGAAVLWIHAASVGEVQAAGILIKELLSGSEKYNVVLSAMTEYGQKVARTALPEEVYCYLAPYDFPQAVKRFLRQIKPDMYIGFETELWPVLLTEIHSAGIPGILLNGRMSDRSFRNYSIFRGSMGKLLKVFSEISVIRDQDKQRFSFFDIPEEHIHVTGNIKYDYVRENIVTVRDTYRSLLGLQDELLFICGSTRSGEEKILAEVFRQLLDKSGHKLVWLVAPRHLERLDEVINIVRECGFGYDLYSQLGQKKRQHSIIIVDIMGELARIYSAGDFNFSGGSFAEKGGHNIMEAARWGNPVYYGPNMDDFKDAVQLLENAGAGFQVADGEELVNLILDHMNNMDKYALAGQKALEVTQSQQGAARRQADIVRKHLSSRQH